MGVVDGGGWPPPGGCDPLDPSVCLGRRYDGCDMTAIVLLPSEETQDHLLKE